MGKGKKEFCNPNVLDNASSLAITGIKFCNWLETSKTASKEPFDPIVHLIQYLKMLNGKADGLCQEKT